MDFCDDCGRRLRRLDDICLPCRTEGPYSCDIYYPTKWEDHSLPFSQNIIRAKQGNKEAVNYLCEKMYDYLLQYESLIDDVEIIIPVPNEKRGYKNATLIAEEFAKIIRERVRKNIRSSNSILERVAKSDPYRKTSSRADKYNSSLQDYKVNKKLKEYMLKNGIKNILKNKKILLIDDNSTSGITIGVCSTRLLQLGAKQVIMFCAGSTYLASVPYLPSGT